MASTRRVHARALALTRHLKNANGPVAGAVDVRDGQGGTCALAAQALPCARLSACSGPKALLAPSPFSGFKSVRLPRK